MNAIASHRDFTSLRRPAAPPAPIVGVTKRGLLRRLFDAIAQAEQRRIDREAARFFGGRLSNDGMRLTDELERRLAERFEQKGGFQP